MTTQGKQSRKKEPDCIVIGEEQLMSNKEFRQCGQPKPANKAEEEKEVVVQTASKPI